MPKRKRRTPSNRYPFGLLQLGAICMFAGPFSYLLQQQFWPLGPLVTANLKGQAAGRAAASVVIFVVGTMTEEYFIVQWTAESTSAE